MTPSKVQSGPKIASVIKKNEKEKLRVIKAKEMNFKVMTNSLKNARNFFWKKSKQWETRAKIAWNKLKAKKNDNENIGVCPTLLTIIQKAHKLEEFLRIVSLGEGMTDVIKFEKLHNSQVLATLVIDTHTSNKRVTKTMRISFLSKDEITTKMQRMNSWLQIWHNIVLSSLLTCKYFFI